MNAVETTSEDDIEMWNLAEAAEELVDELKAPGLRSDLMPATNGSFGARARRARMTRLRYVLVIGAQEASGTEFAVKLREGGQAHSLPRSKVVNRILGAVRDHGIFTDRAFVAVLASTE